MVVEPTGMFMRGQPSRIAPERQLMARNTSDQGIMESSPVNAMPRTICINLRRHGLSVPRHAPCTVVFPRLS
eukprot:10489981-Alexandrium_andersonii.AAC.1